jgi:hypothetical protein
MYQIQRTEGVDTTCVINNTTTKTGDTVVAPKYEIELFNKGNGAQYAISQIQTEGEYDPSMNEWTVILKNNSLSYPLNNLKNLQLRIGNEFSCSFDGSSQSIQDIHVRVHRLQGGEKSFIFIVGGDLMLLGRVKNWPESKCESENDEEFNGDLEKLYQLLSLERRDNINLVFTYVIFKDNIISGFQKNEDIPQDWKDTWETFD